MNIVNPSNRLEGVLPVELTSVTYVVAGKDCPHEGDTPQMRESMGYQKDTTYCLVVDKPDERFSAILEYLMDEIGAQSKSYLRYQMKEKDPECYRAYKHDPKIAKGTGSGVETVTSYIMPYRLNTATNQVTLSIGPTVQLGGVFFGPRIKEVFMRMLKAQVSAFPFIMKTHFSKLFPDELWGIISDYSIPRIEEKSDPLP